MPREADIPEALKWGKRACDLGDMTSCNDYAILLIQRNDGSDRGAAKDLLERQCDAGFDASCATLGTKEHDGFFGQTNVNRSRELWRRACACGNMDGCARTANVLFDRGDKAAALILADYACQLDHFWSCTSLGTLYSEGKFVERDDVRARRYFDHACSQNDWRACDALKLIGQSGSTDAAP